MRTALDSSQQTWMTSSIWMDSLTSCKHERACIIVQQERDPPFMSGLTEFDNPARTQSGSTAALVGKARFDSPSHPGQHDPGSLVR